MKKTKNIVIICFLDGYANSIVPLRLAERLKARGHIITLINTRYRFKNYFKTGFFKKTNNTPQIDFLMIYLFFIEFLMSIQQEFASFSINYFYYYLFLLRMKVRAKILKKYLKDDVDFIICVSPLDALIILLKQKFKKIYYCPTPYADELYYGKQLTKIQYIKFKELEKKIFENSDYLSFHWETYGNYIRKYYDYKKDNIFKLNMLANVQKNKKRAKYSDKPKIVYIGLLSGYWINMPLLAKLAKIYPYIDVYGSPMPDNKYGLHYIGYAKPDVLSNYQFGLITLSKDILRKEGFSAKHLEYISYGLPVLVPDWRKSLHLINGSIPYNEKNFLELITHYSKKEEWDRISNKAYNQAKTLSSNISLKSLIRIIER